MTLDWVYMLKEGAVALTMGSYRMCVPWLLGKGSQGAHIRLKSIMVKRARADRVHILLKHIITIIYSISEKKRFFLVGETVL